MSIPTPHISCLDKNLIAKTVLMPGDPKRAKYIAEHFLTDVICFNEVRGMLGFTGYYKGHKVSVMGSGMGMPSIGIYSYELFTFYDVDRIIRVGSAGAYVPGVDVMDVVIAKDAYSQSSFALVQNGEESNTIPASPELTNLIIETSKEVKMRQDTKVHIGTIHSSDVFYTKATDVWKKVSKEHNALCVEMESFALFNTARFTGKEAACILTISDSFITHKEIPSIEREQSFNDMITLALESAIK